jgi:hypothetical protein
MRASLAAKYCKGTQPMRLNEFTNAAEQLSLLRVIFDNTWSAIEQEAQQQARAAAEKAASKPKRGRISKVPAVKPSAVPPVRQALPAPVAKPLAPVNKAPVTTPAQKAAALKQQANKMLPFNP